MSEFTEFAKRKTSKGQSSDATDRRLVYSVTDIAAQGVPGLDGDRRNPSVQNSFGLQANPTGKLSTVMSGDSGS